MSILKTSLIFAALEFVRHVAAHGSVLNLCKGGQCFGGIAWAHEDTSNAVGWVTPAPFYNEFIDGPRYGTEEIICNTQTTPPPQSVQVAAGETLTAQWSGWPDHHRGPVITYLADCKGPCKDVNKNTLEFFKIAEDGMSQDIPSDQPITGHWATDDLRAKGDRWDIRIPSGIAAGNYVLRHEIIALQEVQNTGAQNYPRCFNVQITGGGSDRPAGVLGTKLYSPSEPGFLANIFEPQPGGYKIPGPALYSGGTAAKAVTPAPAPAPAAAAVPAPAPAPAPEAAAPIEAQAAPAEEEPVSEEPVAEGILEERDEIPGSAPSSCVGQVTVTTTVTAAPTATTMTTSYI